MIMSDKSRYSTLPVKKELQSGYAQLVAKLGTNKAEFTSAIIFDVIKNPGNYEKLLKKN